MNALEVLIDGIGRSRDAILATLEGLPAEIANQLPGGTHNSISWLAWHAARQQDGQIAELSGGAQVWSGWVGRFGLDIPPNASGYGMSIAQVRRVQVTDLGLLQGYLRDATEATIAYIRRLGPADLDEVIDENWDPPVTRGVRLVSIVDDAAQHAGQAAYVRGLLAG